VIEQYKQNKQYHHVPKDGDKTNCSMVTETYPPDVMSLIYT